MMKASVCPVCDVANELYDTLSSGYAELQAYHLGNEIRKCWHCASSFIPEYAMTNPLSSGMPERAEQHADLALALPS